MDCPKCNHPFPEGAKFCNECGASLANQKRRGIPKLYWISGFSFTVGILCVSALFIAFHQPKGSTSTSAIAKATKNPQTITQTTPPSDSTANTSQPEKSNQSQNDDATTQQQLSKPPEDTDVIYPGSQGHVQVKNISDHYKIILDDSITKPDIRDYLLSIDPSKTIDKFIQQYNLQRWYPISITYLEQNGNIFTMFAAEHQYGSKADTAKVQIFGVPGKLDAVDDRSIYDLYIYWQGSLNSVKVDLNLERNLIKNETIFWYIDRGKRQAVGIPIGKTLSSMTTPYPVITPTFSGANPMRYSDNGKIFESTPLVLIQNSTIIGHAEDGQDWKAIDDFFDLPN